MNDRETIMLGAIVGLLVALMIVIAEASYLAGIMDAVRAAPKPFPVSREDDVKTE